MKSIYLKTAVTAVLMAAGAVAFAAPGGIPGPPGGKGPPNGEEAGNNLSVPTIMIGTGGLSVACGAGEWSALVEPAGEPIWYEEECIVDHDGVEICVDAGFYFVQGEHTWQAQCMTSDATGMEVKGAFGDNLSGDAKLKIGKPIRVELVLEDPLIEMYGYDVIKLEPSELDRVSTYGTLAEGDETSGYAATAVLFPVGVYDTGATFSVQHLGTGEYAVAPGTNPTAEINAKGRVVYGYNLRVQELGQYEIVFDVPRVTFSEVVHGTPNGSKASIVINVVPGGGGGGKPR